MKIENAGSLSSNCSRKHSLGWEADGRRSVRQVTLPGCAETVVRRYHEDTRGELRLDIWKLCEGSM